jgi:hypothetical protein
MGTLSKKQLEWLQKQGKIKSFTETKTQGMPGYSGDQRSKGKEWLGWNLPYWANQKGVELATEYQFCDGRKWRFDFAIPSSQIAIEYEGGIFRQYDGQAGAHSTAALFTKDMEKYNTAAMKGWRVIRVGAMNYKTVFSFLNAMI